MASKNTKAVTDMLGRQVLIPKLPSRVISLVPSQTEYLAYLGLEKEVLGITKFCVHPNSWFRSKARVGGTKQVDFKKIETLQPDLIIANKEENQREQIEQLAAQYPVWISDIYNLADAYTMMLDLGAIFSKTQKAKTLVEQLESDFQSLKPLEGKKSAAYFIWKNPYMVAAKDTFIHHMIEVAGFENVFSNKMRYPAIELADLAQKSPDFILLSSEPFPFNKQHFEPFQKNCPNAKIIVVDGELFSWYGSRLRYTSNYFEELRTKF